MYAFTKFLFILAVAGSRFNTFYLLILFIMQTVQDYYNLFTQRFIKTMPYSDLHKALFEFKNLKENNASIDTLIALNAKIKILNDEKTLKPGIYKTLSINNDTKPFYTRFAEILKINSKKLRELNYLGLFFYNDKDTFDFLYGVLIQNLISMFKSETDGTMKLSTLTWSFSSLLLTSLHYVIMKQLIDVVVDEDKITRLCLDVLYVACDAGILSMFNIDGSGKAIPVFDETFTHKNNTNIQEYRKKLEEAKAVKLSNFLHNLDDDTGHDPEIILPLSQDRYQRFVKKFTKVFDDNPNDYKSNEQALQNITSVISVKIFKDVEVNAYINDTSNILESIRNLLVRLDKETFITLLAVNIAEFISVNSVKAKFVSLSTDFLVSISTLSTIENTIFLHIEPPQSYLLPRDKTALNIKNMVLSNPRDMLIFTKQEYVQTINNLQNQPYVLSKSYLNSLLSLDAQVILSELDIDLDNYVHFTKGPEFYKASRFLTILYVADVYSDLNIYTQWAIDGRGRIYSVDEPLSFQKQEIFRYLFTFSNSPVTKSYTDNFNKVNLNIWERLNLVNHHENAILGWDATCSAYQIIGGIMRDKNLLLYTNVIGNNRLDLYDKVLEEFNNTISADALFDKYTNYLNNLQSSAALILARLNSNKIKKTKNWYKLKRKARGLSLYTSILNKDFIQDMLSKIDRKIVKLPIMAYAYNQTSYGATQNLMGIFVKKYKTVNNKHVYYICHLIITHILDILNKMFPSIKLFKTIMSILPALCPTTILRTPTNIHYFKQNYKVLNLEQFSIWSRYRKQPVTLQKYSGNVNPEKSFKKNSIALSPNYIHYLDSNIAIDVLQTAQKATIPLVPIHDCFYTTSCYHRQIINFYRESYIKHLFTYSPLLYILERNGIKYTYDTDFTVTSIWLESRSTKDADKIKLPTVTKAKEQKWKDALQAVLLLYNQPEVSFSEINNPHILD